MKNIILIGAAGHQGCEYFQLLAQKYRIVALIDENLEILQKKYIGCDIPLVRSLEEVPNDIEYDTAIVCVPHYLHKEITLKLIKRNKTVIKEKPLAITSEDIDIYSQSMQEYNNYKLLTIVQRSFNPSFIRARQKLPTLGQIYNYRYIYSLNLPNQTVGWRADWNKSYGGVLLDMGYHALDVIFSYFSKSLSSTAAMSYCYEEMKNRKLEDSISILMKHNGDISGSLLLNRHDSFKEESFTILGEYGILKITPKGYERFDRYGHLEKCVTPATTGEQIKLAMFEAYLSRVEDIIFLKKHFNHHRDVVREIEHIYNTNKHVQYQLAV